MYERLRFLGFARNDILGDDGELVSLGFWRNDGGGGFPRFTNEVQHQIRPLRQGPDRSPHKIAHLLAKGDRSRGGAFNLPAHSTGADTPGP